jgi:hypothetical protein
MERKADVGWLLPGLPLPTQSGHCGKSSVRATEGSDFNCTLHTLSETNRTQFYVMTDPVANKQKFSAVHGQKLDSLACLPQQQSNCD